MTRKFRFKPKSLPCAWALLFVAPGFVSANNQASDPFLTRDEQEASEVSLVIKGYSPADELEQLRQYTLAQLLDTKVSTASKRLESVEQAPAVVSIVTAEEIAAFGAHNLLQVLERVTSVFMTGSYMFPHGVASIRGDLLTHYDVHTLILINGRPSRETVFGGLNSPIYLGFPLNLIKRIEVVRGPGSVFYGSNAYSGVINLVTFEPDEIQSSASFGLGELGARYQDFIVKSETRDWQFSLSANNFDETGWNYSAVDELGQFNNQRYSESNTSVYASASNGQWLLQSLLVNSNQDHFGALPYWDFKRMRMQRVFADLGYNKKLASHWQVNANLTFNEFDADFKIVEDDWTNHSSDYLLEVMSDYRINSELQWLVGGNWYYMKGFAVQENTLGQAIPEFSETWLSLYSSLDYFLSEQVKLTLGGQFNQAPGGDFKFVPRAGLVWAISSQWSGKLLYGDAYRAPYAAEKSIDVPDVLFGEESLDAEEVTTLDVQFAYRSPSSLLALTYFESEQKNLISRVSDPLGSTASTYANLGKMSSHGFEVESEFQLAEPWLLNASYSYQTNLRDQIFEDYTTVPNRMLKIGLNYRQENYSVGIFDSYFSASADVLVRNPDRLLVNPAPESSHLVSFNLTFDLKNWLDLDLGDTRLDMSLYGYNLLDEDVYVAEFNRSRINSLPLKQGRSWYAEVKLHF